MDWQMFPSRLRAAPMEWCPPGADHTLQRGFNGSTLPTRRQSEDPKIRVGDTEF